MKLHISLIALCAGLTGGPFLADETCPWAGGEYVFKDHGIDGDFTVNADCTELVWSRLNEPETATLERSKHGWAGNLSKAKVELLENGSSLRITGLSGVSRQSTAERKN